jgi:hypothetical protein
MDWMQQGFDFFDPDGAERRRQDQMRDQRIADARERYSRPRAQQPMGGDIRDLANNMQAAQAAHLQSAANNVMQAHSTEMQSRVAQQREMRRMQHEKDLMRMRAEADIYGAAIRSLLG